MQTKKTAPPEVTNNTKQVLHTISSIKDAITNYNDFPCALVRPNQRSIWFGLEFSLFQVKESKEACIKTKNISVSLKK